MIVHALRLFLALATIVVLLSGSVPILHAHTSSEPALYNAECPLVDFATRVAGAPLPSPSEADAPAAAGQDGPWRIALAPPAGVPLPFASRAPPSR